jgi:hypothetical protein
LRWILRNRRAGTDTEPEPAKVRFPAKWQGKNNSGELRNIQENAHPASLFQLTDGFRNMDIAGMMQRQK